MMSSASTARGRKRFKLLGVGLAAVGALLLSSCVALPLPGMPKATPTSPAPTKAPDARNTETTTAAWELPLEPLGQPVVSDGVALVYAKVSGGVEAHAIAVSTGKELWKQPVHPGIGAPAIPLEPALTKTEAGQTAAIFLQAATPPADNGGTSWWTTPVAVDLKTGKELFRGRAELVTTPPFACDDHVDLCFISLDDASLSVEHWIDLTSGEDLSGPDINPLTGNFRPVGKGLYSVVTGATESLARVSYGEVLWQLDVEKIFGKGATTDLGWYFTYSEKLDLYVGSLGYNPTDKDAAKLWETTLSIDLRDAFKTVGFRASSGRVLWSSPGSHVMCARSMGTAATKFEGGDAFPIRCEYTEGFVDYPSGNYRGSRGKVVGYDPQTGDSKWESKPVDVNWYSHGMLPSVNRGDQVMAGTFWDSNLIDTRTGKFRSKTTFEDVFVCLKETDFDVPPNAPYKSATAAGGFTAFPCTKGGTAVPSFTYGALTDVDTTDNGIAVISLEGKVAGYKLLKEFT
ncbi:hypothetical protein ACIPY3_00115 [Paenarthrobacter sp. NPDC089714]|uniref:hypothetical protein n=1 Tax=Paenarthrobacter sp. NPDC089714 TaxID=3364377 RepID=UPI00380A1AE8